jgi:hypothetical protein
MLTSAMLLIVKAFWELRVFLCLPDIVAAATAAAATTTAAAAAGVCPAGSNAQGSLTVSAQFLPFSEEVLDATVAEDVQVNGASWLLLSTNM